MRKRSYAAITTAVIAVSLVALYASGATGAGPHVVSFKTVDTVVEFHPIDLSPNDGDIAQRQLRPGDTILVKAESRIGRTKVADVFNQCQFITQSEAQCQATWRFNGKKGTLRGNVTGAGVLDFGGDEVSRAPLVGGTGHLRGIRGEILRTTVSPGKDQVVFKILDE